MKRIVICALILLIFCGCSKDGYPPPSPLESSIVTPTPTPTPTPAPTPTPSPTPTPPSGINPLNGMPLDESMQNRRPVAVTFNVIKEALPIHGISQADIIYEAIAEGGITRVIGFFADISEVPRVGSVRSTRAYYLDMAQGHDAILMHVGYSEEAKKLIASRKLYTLNGLSSVFTFYYRDKQRLNNKYSLEHTMFANGADVESFLVEKSNARITYNEGYDPFSLLFADKAVPEGGTDATTVKVQFSNYKTGLFEYDADEGVYYVSQYGKPMLDAEIDVQLSVTNVIVLYTSVTSTGDYLGHMKTVMTGTGKGLFINGGKAEEIKWSKDSPDSPFVYTHTDGSPLKLGVGTSYVNIVPLNAKITME